MANKVADYIAASDNANEYSQKQVDDIKPKALEDIDQLMAENAARDDELWDDLEVDNELVVDDYDEVAPPERDLNWSLGLAGLAAVAGIQSFLDNRTNLIINPSAYRAQKLDPFNLTTAELVRAGRRKDADYVSIQRYEALQKKYVAEFAPLQALSNAQLYNELQSTGALMPVDKYISNQMGYVSRMTNYPTGSAQFKEAVADLVNFNSTTAQTTMNRRSVETLSMLRESGGDYNTAMVWILDPNSKHCDYCPARAGEIMTLNEWLEDGLPGADVCRGGDRCNCHLVKA
jgi:hypothetical protein